MSNHSNLPFNWKFLQHWEMHFADQLLKMKTGWVIKEHNEEIDKIKTEKL